VLPPLSGRPIRVEIRQSLGPHLAATSIPQRLILLDSQTLRERGEFERILVHEIFHFAWLRLSNQSRWSWEDVLRSELDTRAKGELGWSAEWRKLKLTRLDRDRRTPAWRRYACESFCDSAAWLYSGLADHTEFTLALRFRQRRSAWFGNHLTNPIPI
jgi:hypothetical protein